MKVPKEARRTARQHFKLCLTDGRLDGTKVRASIANLKAGKQHGLVSILTEFARLVRFEQEKHHAVVESAGPIGDDERAGIGKALTGRHGSPLTCEFRITPGLIGGLRVQIGSDVWDGSIQDRLQRLRQVL